VGQCLIWNFNRFLPHPHHFLIHSYPSGLCSWKNSVINPRISPLHTPAPQMFSKNSCKIRRHIDVLYVTFTIFHSRLSSRGGGRKYRCGLCTCSKKQRRF
jgi:hypothetical protein